MLVRRAASSSTRWANRRASADRRRGNLHPTRGTSVFELVLGGGAAAANLSDDPLQGHRGELGESVADPAQQVLGSMIGVLDSVCRVDDDDTFCQCGEDLISRLQPVGLGLETSFPACRLRYEPICQRASMPPDADLRRTLGDSEVVELAAG